MAAWFKNAAAMGSALPDPVKDQAALAPVPQQAIENKPAPGQTGPKGMSPRTTYSRVNTGSPPVMDAGGMGQKNSPNRGMEFLPAKLAAQRGFMTTMKERPPLQELVKAAMLGTTERLSVNLEAARQSRTHHGVKTASAPASTSEHISTEHSMKLASALGYIEQQLLKEADLMPGEGPGALQVLEATSSETNIDAGESGQATSQNQPPQTPALQPEKAQQGNAGTGLQTNDEMSHPEQPVEPIKNASVSSVLRAVGNKVKHAPEIVGGKARSLVGDLPKGKALRSAPGQAERTKTVGKAILGGTAAVGAAGAGAAALSGRNKESSISSALRTVGNKLKHAPEIVGGKARSLVGDLPKGKALRSAPGQAERTKTVGKAILGGTAALGAAGAAGAALSGRKKESSVPLRLIRKLAEDAINPAQISSGQGQDPMEPPDGASPSEEGVPSEPADVTSQKSMIASNAAAINYTKGQAKSDPKKDVAQVLSEPPLSSATDKVLERAFDATGQAGVKISAAKVKTAATQVGAARVLLSRLLKEANEQCPPGKDKKSTGMAPSTPQAATGASAATMGQ